MSNTPTTATGSPGANPSGNGSAPPRLALNGASKSFGAVHALRDATLELYGGHVRALLGENGAGKSTLVKTLAGVYRPDRGSVMVDGEPVSFHGPLDARDKGIAIIYQEPTLFPTCRSPRTSSWAASRSRPASGSTAASCTIAPRSCSDSSASRSARAPRPRPLDRRPAARRDRQGALVRGARADHGRADRGALGHRGRAALPRHAHAQRARRRGPLHLAPPRGDLRDLRPGHRDARRRRDVRR